MDGVLSDLRCWLNYDILLSSEGIIIRQKKIFHMFFYEILVCFLFETNEDNSNNKNHQYLFKLFLLIMLTDFLLLDNIILFRLESLKEWFVFHDLNCVVKFRQDVYSFFLIYNTLRATVQLFSQFFPSYLLLIG